MRSQYILQLVCCPIRTQVWVRTRASKDCCQQSGSYRVGAAMSSWSGAGLGACRVKLHRDRRAASRPLILAATIVVMSALAESPAVAQTAANPIDILFVGNSFTHGRYPPALNYNAGPGNGTDSNSVHDLLCPSLNAQGGCTSGAEAVSAVTPTTANTPGGTLSGQLSYRKPIRRLSTRRLGRLPVWPVSSCNSPRKPGCTTTSH